MIGIAFVLAIAAAAPAKESRTLHDAELYYSHLLTAYARCVVRDNHARSEKAVLSNFEARDLERRFGDIFIENPVTYVAGCRDLRILDGQAFFFTGEPLRMKLAEALVKADLANQTVASFADRPPLPVSEAETREELSEALAGSRTERGRSHAQHLYDMSAARSWLSHFGECVARSDPPRVHAWLLTNAGTPEDAAATTALAPALGSCLTEGRTFAASKDMLRGTVAVAYYRLAKGGSSTR